MNRKKILSAVAKAYGTTSKQLEDYLLQQNQIGSDAHKQHVAENLGSVSSVLGAGGIGALGAMYTGATGQDAMDVAVPSMSVALAANLAGAIAAAVTKRRTLDEQVRGDKKSQMWNLIPGVGSYNSWKRIGFNLGVAREIAKAKKAEKGAD